MIIQKWILCIDGEEHTIERKGKSIGSKQLILIDGDDFSLPCKPFSFFVGRRQIFRIGERQAVMQFALDGKCEIVLNGKIQEEHDF